MKCLCEHDQIVVSCDQMGEGEQGKLFKNFISVGFGLTNKSIFYFPR